MPRQCPDKPPVEVRVPVPVKAKVPKELHQPVKMGPLPVFVSPADPKATSALTPEGEKRLKRLLLELVTRIRAWEAWDTGGDDGGQ